MSELSDLFDLDKVDTQEIELARVYDGVVSDVPCLEPDEFFLDQAFGDEWVRVFSYVPFKVEGGLPSSVLVKVFGSIVTVCPKCWTIGDQLDEVEAQEFLDNKAVRHTLCVECWYELTSQHGDEWVEQLLWAAMGVWRFPKSGD